MGHSTQYQAGLVIKSLDEQAREMRLQASVLENAGQPDMAVQVLEQRERLLQAIKAFRRLSAWPG